MYSRLLEVKEATASRLPRWPNSTSSPAGVIDSVNTDGIFGWIIDRNKPSDAISFEIVCEGQVLATGRTDRPRSDVTDILGYGENPGYSVSWDAFDFSGLSSLVRDKPEAVIEIFVPSLGALLPKYKIGDHSVAEVVRFFRQTAALEGSLQVPAFEADEFNTADFFTLWGCRPGL